MCLPALGGSKGQVPSLLQRSEIDIRETSRQATRVLVCSKLMYIQVLQLELLPCHRTFKLIPSCLDQTVVHPLIHKRPTQPILGNRVQQNCPHTL